MAIYRDTVHSTYFLEIDDKWFRKTGKIYNYRPVARANRIVRLERNGEGEIIKDRYTEEYGRISAKDMLIIILQSEDV